MPQTTYKNPNIDPIVTASMNAPQGTPVAQAPVTPAPQGQTPPANYVNPNVAMQTSGAMGQPSTVVNVNQPAPQQPTQQPQPKTQAAGTSLAMPASGSVVDLLNAAGTDSSFAARQQLAQQYGIQGYTGTAAQNQDLSKKFLEAFNQQKGKAVPQSSAEATSALDSYFKQEQQQTQALI